MADITVNSTVMREKATALTNQGSSIKNITDDMITLINSMKSHWEGEAAEESVKAFLKFTENFEEKKTTIDQYAQFLNSAADEWDELNSNIINGANGQGV